MKDKELIKQEIERLKHSTPNTYDRSRFMLLSEIEDFIDSLPEEPVREELEGVKFVEEPDLDEAAKEHAANLYGEDWMKNEHVQDNGFKAISNFKFGAGWHKQQMMKDAVDATVHKGLYSKYVKEQDSDTLNKAIEKFIPGDKVKIIIVKEDNKNECYEPAWTERMKGYLTLS